MTSTISKYRSIFGIGVQNTFVYRWNFLLRAMFGIVPLIGTVFIWRAIYAARGEDVAGYAYEQIIFYFLCTILVENLVTPTEDEWQVASDIRDGKISALLTKPLDYLGYRLSLFASGRLVYTLVTLPVVAVIFFVLRRYVAFPTDPMRWILAFWSMGMAACIQFAFAYSLGLLAFWVGEVSTFVFILYSFEYMLSGQLFPIDILPSWIQGWLEWLPFKYELFFPVAIFVGRVEGEALWRGLAIQLGWVFFLFLIARGIWRSGLRKYEAVGA